MNHKDSLIVYFIQVNKQNTPAYKTFTRQAKSLLENNDDKIAEQFIQGVEPTHIVNNIEKYLVEDTKRVSTQTEDVIKDIALGEAAYKAVKKMKWPISYERAFIESLKKKGFDPKAIEQRQVIPVLIGYVDKDKVINKLLISKQNLLNWQVTLHNNYERKKGQWNQKDVKRIIVDTVEEFLFERYIAEDNETLSDFFNKKAGIPVQTNMLNYTFKEVEDMNKEEKRFIFEYLDHVSKRFYYLIGNQLPSEEIKSENKVYEMFSYRFENEETETVTLWFKRLNEDYAYIDIKYFP